MWQQAVHLWAVAMCPGQGGARLWIHSKSTLPAGRVRAAAKDAVATGLQFDGTVLIEARELMKPRCSTLPPAFRLARVFCLRRKPIRI